MLSLRSDKHPWSVNSLIPKAFIHASGEYESDLLALNNGHTVMYRMDVRWAALVDIKSLVEIRWPDDIPNTLCKVVNIAPGSPGMKNVTVVKYA